MRSRQFACGERLREGGLAGRRAVALASLRKFTSLTAIPCWRTGLRECALTGRRAVALASRWSEGCHAVGLCMPLSAHTDYQL